MTQLNTLNIVKVKNREVAERHDLMANDLYLIENEGFVGNKLLESNADGSFKEAETVTMKVTYSSGETEDFKLSK